MFHKKFGFNNKIIIYFNNIIIMITRRSKYAIQVHHCRAVHFLKSQ